MLLIPAPAYSLAQAAWIPRVVIWRDDTDIRAAWRCSLWELGLGNAGELAVDRLTTSGRSLHKTLRVTPAMEAGKTDHGGAWGDCRVGV